MPKTLSKTIQPIDDPVRIANSKLLLENFTMYAYNKNPLNIMGEIDFCKCARQ